MKILFAASEAVPFCKTGGLADTVHDYNEKGFSGNDLSNGFSFKDYNVASLISTVTRALKIFNNKKIWRKIQINGMACDYSWEKSAQKYLELYSTAVKNKKSKK